MLGVGAATAVALVSRALTTVGDLLAAGYVRRPGMQPDVKESHMEPTGIDGAWIFTRRICPATSAVQVAWPYWSSTTSTVGRRRSGAPVG